MLPFDALGPAHLPGEAPDVLDVVDGLLPGIPGFQLSRLGSIGMNALLWFPWRGGNS